MVKKKAFFLDRDGVLNVEIGYLHEAEKTVLLPTVPEALELIHQAGFMAIAVTNQSGVAKNMYPVENIHQVHTRIQRELVKNCRSKIIAAEFRVVLDLSGKKFIMIFDIIRRNKLLCQMGVCPPGGDRKTGVDDQYFRQFREIFRVLKELPGSGYPGGAFIQEKGDIRSEGKGKGGKIFRRK